MRIWKCLGLVYRPRNKFKMFKEGGKISMRSEIGSRVQIKGD